MLKSYEFDDPLSPYVFVNWVCVLVAFGAFLWIHARRRHLCVKPSVQLFFYTHVFAQWPLAIYAGYYVDWLPRPHELVVLVHGFVLLGLLVATTTLRDQARLVWDAVGAGGSDSGRNGAHGGLVLTGSLTLLCLAVYLVYVPFDCTGLHALLFHPNDAIVAREMSLKLLEALPPRYAYSVAANALAPVLFAVAVLMLPHDVAARRWFATTGWVFLLLLVLVIALLTGIKGNAIKLGMAGAFAAIWSARLAFSWSVAARAGGALLGMFAIVYSIVVLFALVPQVNSEMGDCRARVKSTKLPVAGDAQYQTGARPDGVPLSENSGADAMTDPLTERERALLNRLVALEVLGTDFRAWLAWQCAAGCTQSRIELEEQFLAMVGNKAKLAAVGRVLSTEDLGAAIDEHAERSPQWGEQLRDIVRRVFVTPLEVGAWYVHYAQTLGPMGVSGIPKVATLLSLKPINAGSRIARVYAPAYYQHSVLPSTTATAGYLFAQYGYFGLLALPIALAAALALDVALLVLRRMRGVMLLAILGAITTVIGMFLQTDYGTVWVTHGFGLVLLLALLMTAGAPKGPSLSESR